MSNNFDKLLELLFLGSYKELIPILKSLDTPERKELFKDFKPIFELLDDIQNFKHQKNYSFKDFYNFIKNKDINDFIKNELIIIKKNGTLQYSKDYVYFNLRKNIIKVAITDKKSFKSALNLDTFHYSSHENDLNLLKIVFIVILDRKEDWIVEALIDFCNNFERRLSYGFSGISTAIAYFRKTNPEIKNLIYEATGKAMFKEGFNFGRFDNKKQIYIYNFTDFFDSEMILAGLDYDKISATEPLISLPIANKNLLTYIVEQIKTNEFKTSYGVSTPQEEGLGGSAPVPHETPEQSSEVFYNKNKISRENTIKLVFKKLIQNMNQTLNNYWADFFYLLELNEDEITKNMDNIILMLSSSNNKSIDISLDNISLFIDKKLIKIEDILDLLGKNITNSLKYIAEKSFKLLKKAYQNEISIDIKPEESKVIKKKIILFILDGLISKNKDFRKEIIKFIINLDKKIINQEIIKKIIDFYDFISSSEKDLLEGFIVTKEKDTADNFPNIDEKYNEDIGVENKVEFKSIDDLIAKLSSKEKDLFLEKRIKFLSDYKKNNSLTEMDAIKVTDEIYIKTNKFKLAENLDELFDNLLKYKALKNRILNKNDYEYIFASLLKFKHLSKSKEVLNKMTIFNQLTEKFNIYVNLYENSYPKDFHHDLGFILCILYAWHNNGEEVKITSNTKKEVKGDVFMSNPLKSSLDSLDPNKYKNYMLFIKYLKNDINSFLSTPNYEDGWIEPDVFVEKILNLGNKIDIWDLTKALYRIPFIKNKHSEIWDKLKNQLNNLEINIKQALILAFAADNEYQESKNYFIALFKQNNLKIFLVNNIAKNREDIISDSNSIFYLFYAALRTRFGLLNLNEVVPELAKLDIFTGITNRGKFEDNKENYIKLFMHPEVLKKQDCLALNGETKTYFPLIRNTYHNNLPPDEALYYGVWGEFSIFPHLELYFGRYDTLDYPAMAERVFELKILGINREMSKTEGYLDILNLVFQKHVNLDSMILDILFPYKHEEHRQKAVEIIIRALLDGRINIKQLEESFSKRFLKNENPTYIDYFLNDFCNFSQELALVSLYIIEKIIEKHLFDFNPKTTSLILERYYKTLDFLKIKSNNKIVLNNLEKISKGKKSASSEKAKDILNLKYNIFSELPLEIVIYALI
ncbi:MAG: DUF6493 family protein [Candidatus Sericytochromatia bacterium]